MEVQELAPGLWRWTAPHPEWTLEKGGPGGWDEEVGSVYHQADGAILLIDPQFPTDPEDYERLYSAVDRGVERHGDPVHILLTCAWHERSAPDLIDWYRATVWVPDTQPELQIPIDDARWFTPGEDLPGGAVAHDVREVAEEVVYWLPRARALVPGDVLLGDGAGGIRLVPESWLVDGRTQADLVDALRPLLDLPVEHVLVSHGEPVVGDGRRALARALERSP